MLSCCVKNIGVFSLKIDRLCSENVWLPLPPLQNWYKLCISHILLQCKRMFHIFIELCHCGKYAIMFCMFAHVPRSCTLVYHNRIASLVTTVFVRSMIPAPPSILSSYIGYFSCLFVPARLGWRWWNWQNHLC